MSRIALIPCVALTLLVACGGGGESTEPEPDVDTTDAVDVDTDAPTEDGGDTTTADTDATPDATPDTPSPDSAEDVEDTGDSDDASDVPDGTPPVVELAPNPVPGHNLTTWTVAVRVTDDDGVPIARAVASLGARSGVTNLSGDVRFERVPEGVHVLSIRHPEFNESVERVELPHTDPRRVELPHTDPLRVELPHTVSRHFPVLRRRRAPLEFDASVGGTVASGSVQLDVEPGDLVDIEGTGFGGGATADLMPFGDTGGIGEVFPAGIALADGGAFAPVAAFDLSLQDGLGLPVAVADGETISLDLDLSTSPIGPDTELGLWVLDPHSGLWAEAEGAGLTVGDGPSVEVELPHVSVWAIGSLEPRGARCARVAVPGAAAFGDASLRVSSGWLDYTVPITGDEVDLFRLVADRQVEVALLIGGIEVARAGAVPVAQSDDDDSRCDEMGTPAALDVPAPASLGEGDGQVLVRVSVGSCPAPGLTLKVFDADALDEPLFETVLEGAAKRVTGLVTGDYFIKVFHGDELLDEALVVVPEVCDPTCLLDVALHVEPEFAVVPAGGCAPAPCAGPGCDTCVDLQLITGDDRVAAGAAVSLYEPVMRPLVSDDTGGVCEDLPGAAGRELLVLPHGGRPASLFLPAGASCETGGCARATLIVDRLERSCRDGYSRLTGTARVHGFRHPGYTADGVYSTPPTNTVSQTSITVIEGTGRFVDALSDRGVPRNEGSTTAFRRVEQSATGVEHATDLVIRSVISDELGISFEISPDLVAMAGSGDIAIEADQVKVVGDWFETDETAFLQATSGTVGIEWLHRGHVWVRFDVTVQATEDGPGVQIAGWFVTPVLTQGDVARGLSAQLSRYLVGGIVNLHSDENPEGFPEAISRGVDSATGAVGETTYCVPTEGWFMLSGEPRPGTRPPFTSLLTFEGGTLTLAGNAEPGATGYTSTKARWFDDEYVARFYLAAGHDLRAMREHATIVGRAMRDGVGLDSFSEVFLEHPTEGRFNGFHVGDDFGDAGHTGGVFAFINVPPVPPTDPYTLHLIDAAGAEILEYRQQIAPIAGGVGITHN